MLAMPPSFDFDHFARLAQEDPVAFETQRHALLEAAFDELPAALQASARASFAQVQVRMLAAKSPAERLAISLAALNDALQDLQQGFAALRREAVQQSRYSSRSTAA
ncbi:DUF3135 domain-containing protein [Azohydromonas sp. G-1-1-14]|uniref:DUF3135 domain-containing protein n=2 Tax=Azohydromonas caseinilytica TaxID=2728836 RepID=A0A848FID1_9BURK|nr:DUF3135 domain-containing protein [Azohydromonas caseinilytica]